MSVPIDARRVMRDRAAMLQRAGRATQYVELILISGALDELMQAAIPFAARSCSEESITLTVRTAEVDRLRRALFVLEGGTTVPMSRADEASEANRRG